MNVSEIGDFREYVEEQRNLCYGVEGTTPGVHGRIARQYDFLLETIDTYQEIEQPQLNPNQQIVLEWLKATWIDRKKNCWFPFEVINSLYYQFDSVWGNHDFKEVEQIEKEKPYIKAYGELTALEQFEVLEKFSRWALVKEEEK